MVTAVIMSAQAGMLPCPWGGLRRGYRGTEVPQPWEVGRGRTHPLGARVSRKESRGSLVLTTPLHAVRLAMKQQGWCGRCGQVGSVDDQQGVEEYLGLGQAHTSRVGASPQQDQVWAARTPGGSESHSGW